jgi:hypothetical protein
VLANGKLGPTARPPSTSNDANPADLTLDPYRVVVGKPGSDLARCSGGLPLNLLVYDDLAGRQNVLVGRIDLSPEPRHDIGYLAPEELLHRGAGNRGQHVVDATEPVLPVHEPETHRRTRLNCLEQRQ